LDQGGKLVALDQRKQVGERVKLAYLHRRCSCCPRVAIGCLLSARMRAPPQAVGRRSASGGVRCVGLRHHAANEKVLAPNLYRRGGGFALHVSLAGPAAPRPPPLAPPARYA